METVWLALGVLVLGATLLDVFLTALNYDEAGFLASRVSTVQWRLLRNVTRRLPRRWRPVGLRQVTGLQIVVVVLVWLLGTILGYALLYFAQMSRSSFSVSGRGAGLDFFDATYFSAAQLATVGGSALTAETDALRFLSIVESLTGVLLLSLILTFLLGVYDVVGNLNALCRQFSAAERGAGTALASLTPWFRDGQVNGLDGHLDGIADAFAAYTDGLRLHHSAYYFQSGQDQFALPYALRMMGGTLSTLRWGLPSGHPGATQPTLGPLTFQFLEFADYLQSRVRWSDVDVPEVVSRDSFTAHLSGSRVDRPDGWVRAFIELEHALQGLAGADPLADVEDAYQRYTAWLPFTYRAQQVTLAVSADLDYQPVIVAAGPVSMLGERDPVVLESVEEVPEAARWTGRSTHPSAAGPRDWTRLVVGRSGAVDPGHARARTAGRAVLAASAAFVSLHLVFDALGEQAVPPAIFGGFVAMLAAGIAVDRTLHDRKLTSVLMVLPVGAVVLLGALVSGSALAGDVLLVLVACVGVGASRFGARWGALGRVTFMAYYFALLMRLDLNDVPWFAAAALVGMAWAFVCSYVLLPDRHDHQLRIGIHSLTEEMVATVDTLVDAVSWARWDPETRRRVSLDTRRVHRAAAFVAGQLAGEVEATGLDPAHGGGLRLRVFDAELATVTLKDAVRDVTGTALPLELRGRLAGRLELLRSHLQLALANQTPQKSPADQRNASPPTPIPHWDAAPAPEHWPRTARRLVRAIDDVHQNATVLLDWDAEHGALQPLDPYDPEDEAALRGLSMPVPSAASAAGATGDGSDATPETGRVQPAERRAVQAAVSTALALAVGSAISGTHQYWASLAAFQVLGTTDGETFVNGVKRILGTVAGAAVGFGIAIATDAPSEVMIPVLAVAVFGSVYYRPVANGISTFWTTLIFAGIYEFLGRLTTLALEIRILETLLGALIALLVAWKLLPTRTRSKLNQEMGTLVKDVQVVVAGSLERASGREEISPGALQQGLLALDGKVRAITAASAPLRRTTGTLEDGGIESQLTAVWSLTYSARQLAGAVQRAVEDGLDTTGPDWEGLRRRLDQHLAALFTAVSGRVPGEVVDDDLEPGDEDTAPGVLDILERVDHIDRTVLALLSYVSPDPSDDDRGSSRRS